MRFRTTGSRKVTEEFNSVMNVRLSTAKRTLPGFCPVAQGKGIKSSLCRKRKAFEFTKLVQVAERNELIY
ncbi:hypothetical protein ACT9XH_01240 [Methanococcoides methylutens]|uniref:hypothetical protein n=1 Tax=Methanococcoides methylutens TaxID=2226 RepID=UPI004044A4A0